MSHHPATQHLMSLFEYAHLPAHLQDVSKPVADLAHLAVHTLGEGPELTTGLRKLLEAKDCLVRQAVIDHRPIETRSAPAVDVEVRTAAIGVVDEQSRIISGLAVPFGQTANVGYPEQFARGAFEDDVVVSVHANHGGVKRGELPVGVLTASRNRDDGFYVECRIANTARGDEVLELARDGILRYFSVGFVPGEHQMRGDTVVRTKATLREVSLVETPAYSGAVIESVRSAATEGNTDMTPEEKAKLDAAEAEVTALRSSHDELERRVGVLQDAGTSGPSRRTFKTRSFGELLKALVTGDTDAISEYREAADALEADRMETRAFTGQTLAENGLDQPVWLDKMLRLTNRRRPLSTLFSREPLPADGTSFEYPRIIEETGAVTVQAAEGDDLAYLEVKIGTGSGTVRTVGGYTSLSRQAIERNKVSLLDASLRWMSIQYAEAFELFVRSFLLGLPTTGAAGTNLLALAAAKPDSAPEWISVVLDAKASIEDNSKGLLADFILVSRDVFKGIALIEDSTGRPVFEVRGDGQNTWGSVDLSSVELGAQIAGLPVVVAPRLPANSFYVASREAITSMESAGAPFSLQDENIINLTKDFSLYGYQGIYSEQPKGLTKVTWTV